jgi:valyl-tRNA synthetase
LKYVLENILKLAHPFIPFVSEAIWQSFHDDLLMIAEWPEMDEVLLDGQAEIDFELLRQIIIAIRNLRSEHKLPPTQKVTVCIYAGAKTALLQGFGQLIQSLRTGVEKLVISESGEPIADALYARVADIEIYLEAQVDVAAEGKRLEMELKKLQALQIALAERLENKEFVGKAPEKIIAQEKNKLADYETAIEKIKKRLREISS